MDAVVFRYSDRHGSTPGLVMSSCRFGGAAAGWTSGTGRTTAECRIAIGVVVLRVLQETYLAVGYPEETQPLINRPLELGSMVCGFRVGLPASGVTAV